MTFPARILQPGYYDAFRCIGAECEDTCCDGWGIGVDRVTYEKYQKCSDPELRDRLTQLVVINSEAKGEDDYASFQLTETHCSFLAEGLCSIQGRLGEEYLSNVCAIYPRAMNRMGDSLERTLDLSCPEAARIVLLDPRPMDLHPASEPANGFRMGSPQSPGIPNPSYAGREYVPFTAAREGLVRIFQERKYSLWQRLTIAGHFADKLSEMALAGNDADVPSMAGHYQTAIQEGWFDNLLGQCRSETGRQLTVVLELIVNRISSDFTGKRFLDCYRDFMSGLAWTSESKLEEIAERYCDAFTKYYVPFIKRYPEVMERYVLAYVYRNLLPLGRAEFNRKCNLYPASNLISLHGMLLAAHYAIVRTIMIGMSARYRSEFGLEHAIRAIQSGTKAFQHCTTFPAKAMEILTRNGLKSAAATALLVRDPDAGEA